MTYEKQLCVRMLCCELYIMPFCLRAGNEAMKIESQPSGLKRQYYDVDDGDDMPGLMDGSDDEDDDEDRKPHHQRQRPTLLKRLGTTKI